MQTDPTTDKMSLVRPYSLGVAAANIVFGQKELEVTPIEDLSQLDGELTDAQSTIESSGVDKDGNTYSTSHKASNSIKALWLPLDSVRPFPGLIRRGEKVMIWRIGDTDKYYWTEMGLDSTTRRRDILTILVPNSPKEGEDSQTSSTAYYIEINTVDKHITIQTNKNDGEEYAYMIQINSKGGNMTLCDDAGNYFQLDSKLQKLIMKNQMESEISIEKGKGLWKTNDEISLDTKVLNFRTKIINSKSDTFNLTTKGYIGKASDYEFTTGSFKTDAGSYSWTGGLFALKTSAVTHMTINIGMTHKHLGVIPGPLQSGPPAP